MRLLKQMETACLRQIKPRQDRSTFKNHMVQKSNGAQVWCKKRTGPGEKSDDWRLLPDALGDSFLARKR
jgi:hypothetical protein